MKTCFPVATQPPGTSLSPLKQKSTWSHKSLSSTYSLLSKGIPRATAGFKGTQSEIQITAEKVEPISPRL